MIGITPKTIVHRLNVDPNIRLVRQNKRKFSIERREELDH